MILEPSNITHIQKNEPGTTPDDEVIIAYTPGVDWINNEMMKGDPSDSERLAKLLETGINRQPVYRYPSRTYHPLMKQKSF